MTRHDPHVPAEIARKAFVLATDLDGTFLGGSAAQRSAFYAWIEARRDSVGLIFVTGRDPEFIVDLTTRQGVPRPDYVVGDVGTTIAEVTPEGGVRPLPALEAEIAAAWDDRGDRVRSALEGVAGLTLQPTAFRYRVSYDMDASAFDPRAHGIVRDLGCDALVSAGRFFDVLPRGISKGPSLLRLIDHLGIDRQATLAAGDTLNDLSMLKSGLPAVAVGGSEPGLIRHVAALDHVYTADGIGVAGIMEAMAALNLHPDAKGATHAF